VGALRDVQAEPIKRLDRRTFVHRVLDGVPDALVVTGLGSPSYDVFAAGDRDTNFYLWGAMGGAVPVGLGLALAQHERSVVVVTGDGEMLMGIGSLATAAVQAPPNLTIIVLDNGHYGETGMQPSHTSFGANLSAIAAGAGITRPYQLNSLDGISELVHAIKSRTETVFCQVLVEVDEPPRALPPRDGTYLRQRFRASLNLKPF
jgi:thiamine pyrophosphate-dependent acetolactate synthase large subunit-like protein